MEDEVEYDEYDNGEVGEIGTVTVADMVDAAVQSDFASANDHFQDLISAKIADALEQEKIAVANTVFNDQEESEEDPYSELDNPEEVEDLGDDDIDLDELLSDVDDDEE